MKKHNILFRMAARCEAAGRPNNEDNYQLDADLSDAIWGFTADEEISLGDKGSLLVVCDGMGGMNAGEVASALAVKTIKEHFASDKLTDSVLVNPCEYIHTTIVNADAAIKEHSKTNPATEGMGSTVVMAWLLSKKVYVGWCGDSRCYRYNPQLGLERLSHDHSYVQELVDAGKLTEELAFDHPNNNIITRSLGDPRGAAQPDTKEFDLYNQDIILLCSDGLCGTLRDNEIAEIIKANQTSMQECRDALWAADEAAGWTDNVTIGLAQIISGAKDAPKKILEEVNQINMSASKIALVNANKRLKFLLAGIIVLVIMCAAGGLTYKNRSKLVHFFNKEQCEMAQDTIESDSIKQEMIEQQTESVTLESTKKQATTEMKTTTSRKAETKQEVTKIPKVIKAPDATPTEESVTDAKEVEDLLPKIEKSGNNSAAEVTKADKEDSVPEIKKDSTAILHNEATLKPQE